MRAIGIDIGTTTIKGAVLDLTAQTVSRPHSRPFPPNIASRPGRHEVSMEILMDAVDSLLATLLHEAPEASHLFLCGQMHGIVVMDSGGKPLTPFITWKDQRALETHPTGSGTYLEHFAGLLTDEERASLGNELRPGLGGLTLACLENEISLPDKAVPTTVCDAILAAWTGEQPILDPTFAASLGVYQIAQHMWAHEVLEKWHLDRFTWPDLAQKDPASPPGPSYQCHRHGHRLTVYPTLGDHQAALLGHELVESELSINVSTGAQIATLTKFFQPGPYQTRPFPGGRYLHTISHLPAGSMLNLLIDLLTEIPRSSGSLTDPWAYVHQAVSQVAETTLGIDLSFAPSVTGSEGRLTGLTGETLKVGHLFRAAFRQMAQNFHTHAAALNAASPWKAIALSGGLAQRSQPLRQEIERAFEVPLRISRENEETLQGLLYWASYCLELEH